MLLSGCTELRVDADAEPDAAQIVFKASEAAYVLAEGAATITGRIYSQHIPGAHGRVRLIPVTPYSTHRMSLLFGEAQAHYRRTVREDADPDYYRHMRTVVSDHKGQYRFDRVPAGRFYVLGIVADQAEGNYFSHLETVEVAPAQQYVVNLDGH